MERSDVRVGVGVGSVFWGFVVDGFVFVSGEADEEEEVVASLFILRFEGFGVFFWFLDEGDDVDEEEEDESESESESSALDSG